ncbi:hypothetical protein MauCBS54593_006465 [Microsporum audouinii]
MSADSGYGSIGSSSSIRVRLPLKEQGYYPALENYLSSSTNSPSPASFTTSSTKLSAFVSSTENPPECVRDETVQARKEAKELLAIYRTTLVELEIRRISSSRKGLQKWVEYWNDTYQPHFSGPLCQKIQLASPEINRTFKEASQDIYQIIDEVEETISTLPHPYQIRDQMACMRSCIRRVVGERQMRAGQLMEWLRCDIEATPIDIHDKMFDRLKKQVYGLDPSGHYHPSPEEPDSADEEEEPQESIEERLRQQLGLLNMTTLPDSLRQVLAMDNVTSHWTHNNQELTIVIDNPGEVV